MKAKRCPFCNGSDLTLDVTISTYAIRCFDCGAQGPPSTEKDRALAWWNGRLEVQKDAILYHNQARLGSYKVQE